MATRKCCSGCSGSNNCYGALNYVPGPYVCGRRSDPYYTGPCGSINGNNCSRPPCCCPPYAWEDGTAQPDPNPPTPSLPPAPTSGLNTAYGFFTAAPPMSVAAGGAVPLQTELVNDCYFSNSNGSILIRRAGVYLISYIVQTGAGETAGSRYYLALNGTAINGSTVNAGGDAATGETYAAQVIVQAATNSMLTLNSTDAISPAAAALPTYSLTIVRPS